MRTRSRRALDLFDQKSPNEERVGNQSTMAPPRHSFRTPQCNSFLPGMRDEPLQSLLKLRRLHVVCISAKALVPPASIDRLPHGMSQTTKPAHMPVADAGAPQGARQYRAVELRLVAGARNRSHVDLRKPNALSSIACCVRPAITAPPRGARSSVRSVHGVLRRLGEAA